MYKKIRVFIEHRIEPIGQVFVGIIISLWILSFYVPVIQEWIQRQNLIGVIIVVLLVDAITLLVELKHTSGKDGYGIFSNQSEALPDVIEFLRTERPKKADLLEYSTHTIQELLLRLKQDNCDIRLLVQDPETAITSYQKERITAELKNLVYVTFREYKRIHIKCYRVPGTLRGRNFDDKFVSVGWYTYVYDEPGIYGHTNPMINTHTDSEQGRALLAMFKVQFYALWNDSRTLSLSDVLKNS